MVNEKHRAAYTAESASESFAHTVESIQFGGGEYRLDLTAPRPFLAAFHQALGDHLKGTIYDDTLEGPARRILNATGDEPLHVVNSGSEDWLDDAAVAGTEESS